MPVTLLPRAQNLHGPSWAWLSWPEDVRVRNTHPLHTGSLNLAQGNVASPVFSRPISAPDPLTTAPSTAVTWANEGQQFILSVGSQA